MTQAWEKYLKAEEQRLRDLCYACAKSQGLTKKEAEDFYDCDYDCDCCPYTTISDTLTSQNNVGNNIVAGVACQ